MEVASVYSLRHNERRIVSFALAWQVLFRGTYRPCGNLPFACGVDLHCLRGLADLGGHIRVIPPFVGIVGRGLYGLRDSRYQQKNTSARRREISRRAIKRRGDPPFRLPRSGK